MTPGSRDRLHAIAAMALVLLFVAEGLSFIAANSQTADEAAHMVVGYSYWRHGEQRLNPDYPPLLRALFAVPVYLWYRPILDPVPASRKDDIWRIGRDFLYTTSDPGDRLLSVARLPNLVLGTVLLGLALAAKLLSILLPGMVALLLAGQAIFGRTAPWPWLGPRANAERLFHSPAPGPLSASGRGRAGSRKRNSRPAFP